MSFAGTVIGVDFGADTCVIAQAKRGGIDIVMNEASKRKTQSLVGFQGNQRFLGAAAAPLSKSNYKNTVRGFKRLLGLKFNSDLAQKEINRMPNKDKFVELDNGMVGVKVNYNDKEEIFSMEQVTAMLLSRLRAIANKDDLPGDVVLSVPGWWNESQRKALLDSCQISGFSALRILNDHTAAALSYGIYKSARNVFNNDKQQIVMFIDVGYSTTSVAIVGFIQGKLNVISSAFDESLGGRDFDDLLFNKFVQEFKEKHKLDVNSNAKSVLKLMAACEKAKQTLTPEGVTVAKVTVEYLMQEIDFRSEILLEDFESLAEENQLLKRFEKPIEQALAKAKLTSDEINSVEIVGGGSRPRIVKKTLAKIMKLDETKQNYGLSTTLNSDEAVARGCALNSAMLSPVFRVKEFNVFDVVNEPVLLSWEKADIENQIKLKDGEEEEEEENEANRNSVLIIQKGMATPCTKRVTFRRNNAFEIKAKYDNEEEEDDFATFKIDLKPDEKNKDNLSKVRVDFSVDNNGLFYCSSAEALYEKKEEEKKVEEKKEDDDEKAKEENADEKMEDSKEKAEEKKVEKKKIKYTKVKINVKSEFKNGLEAKVLKTFIENEKKFAKADKEIEETNEAKNLLEEFVYSFRDKVDGRLKEFVTEEEKESYSKKLAEEESWLYDEGFDETKEVYRKRLNDLKKDGDRFQKREEEFYSRPKSEQILKEKIESYEKVIESEEEIFDHISEEERTPVRKKIAEVKEWLEKQIHGQSVLPKSSDPVLTSAMIEEQKLALERVGQRVVYKVRPPPPKPKEEEKKEEKEGEDVKMEADEENKENADEENDGNEVSEGMEVD